MRPRIIRPEIRTALNYIDSLENYRDKNNLSKLSNEIDEYNRICKRNISNVYPHSDEIIFSTYFTSKKDPQRGVFSNSSNFEYIKEWYHSIKQLGLKAIIFIDFINEKFLEKYQDEDIKFVNCELGELSLNDERFFIYYEYLLKHYDKIKSCLFTDINDVVFLKNPFVLLNSNRSNLFVGRNNTNLFLHSKFNLEKIMRYEVECNLKYPVNFFHQPIYNAGIIGGSLEVVLLLFNSMIQIFKENPSKNNYNMLVLNTAIFKRFLPRSVNNLIIMHLYTRLPLKFSIIFYKILIRITKNKRWADEEYVKNKKDTYGNSMFITTSYPLNNHFKSYIISGGEYIIHK